MLRITLHNLGLKDFDSIYTLSQTLANFFPKPEHSAIGIYELLVNALEHGNLGIGYDMKSALIRQGKWHEEIIRRLSLPEYTQREVHITLTHDAYECRLTICDQGNGFAWQDYIGRISDDRRPNGRGLWIAFNNLFDDIAFNACGNEVTCVSHYSHAQMAKHEFAEVVAA